MNKSLLYSTSGLLILLLAIIIYMFNKSNNCTSVRYIDLNTVFSEYNYTKEYKENLEHIRLRQSQDLDSLKQNINQAIITDSPLLEDLKNQYFLKVEEYDKILKQYAEDTESKIWQQLNSYTKEFSKENKINILLGANGTGNIMYGDSSLDCTNEFILSVNNKFDN